MATVRGFFMPKTATGRSSLLPSPPWYYSGDLLTVEYRTDPAKVAALLPEPLSRAPEDPGAVAMIWADWQSCSEGGQELLDPVRSQYKECFVAVRCSYRGQIYSRCVFIWVDKDFALAWTRGFGRGRVFYTALGHEAAVWKDSRFQQHLAGGIQWATGSPSSSRP